MGGRGGQQPTGRKDRRKEAWDGLGVGRGEKKRTNVFTLGGHEISQQQKETAEMADLADFGDGRPEMLVFVL
jgi:hypothetical protein